MHFSRGPLLEFDNEIERLPNFDYSTKEELCLAFLSDKNLLTARDTMNDAQEKEKAENLSKNSIRRLDSSCDHLSRNSLN